MQIFGVGPLELLLILVLALVIMGPQDMVGTARKMGQWVYRVVRSPTWRAIMETTQEFRDLPQKIVRDAGLDEAMKEIKDTADQVKTEMEATTREINSEMQAATNEINSELNTAAQQVNSDLQQVTSSTTDLAAGVAPFSNGEAQALSESGVQIGIPMIDSLAQPAQSLDDLNQESILWPDLAAETQPEPVASTETAPVAAPADPYVICLDTFATALGGTMLAPDALELAPAPVIPQSITPEMIASVPEEPAAVEAETAVSTTDSEPEAPVENAPHPWAPGLALSGPAEVDMQARFQAQMAEMEKSFEELDAKIMAQAETQAPQAEPIEEMILPQAGEPAETSTLAGEETAPSIENGEVLLATEESVVSETEITPAPAEPASESQSGEKPADELSAEFGAAEESAQNSPEDQPAG